LLGPGPFRATDLPSTISRGAWVKEQQVKVENGKVTLFRVDLKLTFVLD